MTILLDVVLTLYALSLAGMALQFADGCVAQYQGVRFLWRYLRHKSLGDIVPHPLLSRLADRSESFVAWCLVSALGIAALGWAL